MLTCVLKTQINESKVERKIVVINAFEFNFFTFFEEI